jgi:Holliday junction resolvasome RuvABC DNA-binding subunit
VSEAEAAKTVTVTLEEKTAERLAAFCKRAFIERVQPFASSRIEAERMLMALEELGSALEKLGYSPR